MKKIGEQEINEIREKADIVDVISRYISVERKGKDYKSVCPFHDDHDPSLSISPNKQIYKCFVCGAGGNVFGFVSSIENIPFIESVVKVASYVNIDLSQSLIPAKPVDVTKQNFYKIMDEANNFMHYQLNTGDGQAYLEFLHQRGYDQDVIDEYQIGACFNENQCANFLLAKGYKSADLVKLDLVRVQGEQIRDVFFNRVTFPIYNQDGKCIAFSARTIDKNNDIKYINTSETPLYTKGNVLYRYHNARPHALKQGFVVVVEGVTDTIAYYRSGIKNVVATLGTACTNQQISLIKQCSWNVVLSYDGDKAGLDANYKLGKQLIEMKCNVEVCYNIGLDPDEVYHEFGEERLVKTVENRMSWINFTLQYAQMRYGLDSHQNRKRIVEFMIEHLTHCEPLDRNYYIQKISELTGFKESDISSLVTKEQKQSAKTFDQYRENYKLHAPEPLAYLEILNQMNLSKNQAFLFRKELGFLPTKSSEACAMLFLEEYHTKDHVNLADLLSKNLDQEITDILLYLGNDFLTSMVKKSLLMENINLVKVYLIDRQIVGFKQSAEDEQDTEKKNDLMKKIVEKQREKRKLLRSGGME